MSNELQNLSKVIKEKIWPISMENKMEPIKRNDTWDLVDSPLKIVTIG